MQVYLGARSLTGSTGCRNKLECLLDFSFCKAVRHALRSKDVIPPLCALCMALASLFFGFTLIFVPAAACRADVCLVTACPATGVEREDWLVASAWADGTRRIFGVTGVETDEFLGPPDLIVRDGFDGMGSLTAGRGGGISTTGVGGGRWIDSFGGASSAPRTRTSANLIIDHRTSWSMSGALGGMTQWYYFVADEGGQLTEQWVRETLEPSHSCQLPYPS